MSQKSLEMVRNFGVQITNYSINIYEIAKSNPQQHPSIELGSQSEIYFQVTNTTAVLHKKPWGQEKAAKEV